MARDAFSQGPQPSNLSKRMVALEFWLRAWDQQSNVTGSRGPSVFIKVCEKALQEPQSQLDFAAESEMCKELELQKDPSRKAPIQQLNIAVNTNLDGTAGTQKPKLIRELRHDQVEKLVVIQGICTAVRTPRSKVRRVVLRCTNCENVEEVYIEGGFTAAHIPAACKRNALRAGNLERCPPNSFVADASLSEYAADQRVRLQELPEHVPVGEMPRSIDLCAQMYDVDLCTPGTRLTCVGVFNASEKAAGDKLTRGRNQGTNTVKYSYVQVLGLQRAQGNRSQGALEISADEEERFEQLAKDPGIREKIFQSIAPAICATEKDVVNDVKRAVACLLFGGSRKFLPSGNRIRGDINVLLLGDPGTAKSQILKFGEKAAPISVYTSGKGSSAAGLTAAIVKEKNGFALEGGAMVLADGGIVCIDEFDKMDAKDRVAIHEDGECFYMQHVQGSWNCRFLEAMEQQTISISKAGITTMP
ncbi:mcm5 [Symbiodinium necroappetens]|uniref:DNA replication licensing factor MCM5 n=1 Tax=Symbiodinium necroappetens TaxID=1628268 RepID=A0A812ZST4_9DINO|nr:mcm5 [Symbiodinium necroappetens]